MVRTAERRVNQVAAIWAALVNRQLVAVLNRALDFVKVAEVNVWVDALAEQVKAKGY